jgi:hypothetical protein
MKIVEFCRTTILGGQFGRFYSIRRNPAAGLGVCACRSSRAMDGSGREDSHHGRHDDRCGRAGGLGASGIAVPGRSEARRFSPDHARRIRRGAPRNGNARSMGSRARAPDGGPFVRIRSSKRGWRSANPLRCRAEWMVPPPRLERGTPRSTIWCSNQLSYGGTGGRCIVGRGSFQGDVCTVMRARWKPGRFGSRTAPPRGPGCAILSARTGQRARPVSPREAGRVCNAITHGSNCAPEVDASL